MNTKLPSIPFKPPPPLQPPLKPIFAEQIKESNLLQFSPMPDQDSDQWLCPSFSTYSSKNLTEIAAGVCNKPPLIGGRDEDHGEDRFEFISVSKDSDEYFPFFGDKLNDMSFDKIPLNTLLIDGDDTTSSSLLSEIDELDGISSETYCVWTPKAIESPPGRCQKSKSTGSTSKLRKLCDFVRRSNSTGACRNDSIRFFRCSSTKKIGTKVEKRSSGEVKLAGKVAESGKTVTSAYEKFYGRNGTAKERMKRQSYLPYKRDLIGFCSSVN